MTMQVYCDRDKSFRIVDENEQTVALVKCNRADVADNERGLKLATVFAAGPEMLEALKAVAALLEEAGGQLARSRMLVLVRAAIVKAEGRSA